MNFQFQFHYTNKYHTQISTVASQSKFLDESGMNRKDKILGIKDTGLILELFTDKKNKYREKIANIKIQRQMHNFSMYHNGKICNSATKMSEM